MADLDNNSQFNDLRNLLDNAEIEPSGDLWSKIESKLDKDKTKPYPYLLWSVLGLLFVGVPSVGLFYQFNNQSVGGNNGNISTSKSELIAESGKVYLAKNENSNLVLNNGLDTLNNSTSVLNNENHTYQKLINENKNQSIELKGANSNNLINSVLAAKNNLEIQNLNVNNRGVELAKNNYGKTKLEENKRIKNSVLNNLKVENKSVENNLVSSSGELINYGNVLDSQLNNNNRGQVGKTINNKNETSKLASHNLSENLFMKSSFTSKSVKKIVELPQNELYSNLERIPQMAAKQIKLKIKTDSIRTSFNKKDVISDKKRKVNIQKSYDLISSLNYFYNNNYNPESNLLVNNSYKYGLQANYYFNKHWGIGLGIIQNTVSYNSVLLEKQNQNFLITSFKELKISDSVYVFQKKDSTITKLKEVSLNKSLQIKSVNIPLQLLFKFHCTPRLNVENRMGVVCMFASNDSKKITRPVGFTYQHNINLLYSITSNIQVVFGPEYSFYITDLVQNKSGWFPLGVNIGARLNLK